MDISFFRPEVPEGEITIVLSESEAVALYKVVPYYNAERPVRRLMEELREVLAANCLIEG